MWLRTSNGFWISKMFLWWGWKHHGEIIIIGDHFKTTVYPSPILFQNKHVVQTPADFCKQAKHIRWPHKKVYTSLQSSNRLWGNSVTRFLTSGFFINQFPPGPWVYHYYQYYHFSRRYSELKVHQLCHWHRWQMEKIFNQKNFNFCFGTPLVRWVNI